MQEPDEKRSDQGSKLLESGLRGYVAGVLDCDGSIWISSDLKPTRKHTQYRLHVSVTNTRSDLPKWFAAQFGGVSKSYPARSEKWRPEHRWACSGLRAASVVSLALPYLIIKHQQGLYALEFGSTITPGCKQLPESFREIRARLYGDMLVLNKRGPA